jgi:Tfp pilus assembly major pilin PilA
MLMASQQRPVSWILWSDLNETAIIVIPEEAEQIIKMMHAKETHPKIYLITYASPVTRKMLAFNDLTFFSMPALPQGWVAPQWLKTELGLLAGRLYFEWHEYGALCKFLGITEDSSSGSDEENGDVSVDDGEYSDEDENDDINDDLPAVNGENGNTVTTTRSSSSFSARPLTFLQEWLAIRRHGQDFAHTPMGFLAQGKPLQANHPFFGGDEGPPAPTQNGDDNGLPPQAGTDSRAWRGGQGGQDGDGIDEGAVIFDGVDDMGANVGGEGEEDEGEEVVYDDSEYASEYYTDEYSEGDSEAE